jgi:hypothetical protein
MNWTESESYVTTDSQLASLSWNEAPIWGLRPDFYYRRTVAGLLMWGALSDERTGLSFTIAAGTSQRSHSLRATLDSRPYFTLSDLRLPISSPPTTRRVTVEVFDPASTWVMNWTESESYVTTDGQSASLSWYKTPIWAYDQIFIAVRNTEYVGQLRSWFRGAPSLTRGRVCLLYVPLAHANEWTRFYNLERTERKSPHRTVNSHSPVATRMPLLYSLRRKRVLASRCLANELPFLFLAIPAFRRFYRAVAKQWIVPSQYDFGKAEPPNRGARHGAQLSVSQSVSQSVSRPHARQQRKTAAKCPRREGQYSVGS